jgi:hypothetical protein
MRRMDIAAAVAGERMMAKDTGAPARPPFDEIARLAYRFYEMRGRRDGSDVDDWLCAERALAHYYR